MSGGGSDGGTGSADKDAVAGYGTGGGTVSCKVGDTKVSAANCDYIGQKPDDTSGTVFGTTFLCRVIKSHQRVG